MTIWETRALEYKMKNYLLTISVSASLCSAVVADTTTVSGTTPGTYAGGTSGGTSLNYTGSILTISQWNPASFPGMTLTGVEYRLTSFAYGTYTINNGAQIADFEVSLSNISSSLTGPFGTSPALSRNNSTFGGGVFQTLSSVAANASVSGTTTLAAEEHHDIRWCSAAELDTLQPAMSKAVKWYCRKAIGEISSLKSEV